MALLACGTAPRLPPSYESALRRAEGLERTGVHGKAADAYARTRRHCGGRPVLCARAIVREAGERERAGQPERALPLWLEVVRRYPRDREAPRALRRAARLELAAGRTEQGRALLRQAIVRYAARADASSALRDLLLSVEGGEPALAELASLEPRVRGTAIGDNVLYARARIQIDRGESAAARRTLQQLVREYPYPSGGMWDDALWLLADLSEEAGDPRGAIRWLEQMVAVQESTTMVGSYNLPRFDDAELRIARLWLGPLRDPARAIAAAERLTERYPDSVLFDDALVLAARAEHARGRDARACALREELAEHDRLSRFLRPGRWPIVCP